MSKLFEEQLKSLVVSFLLTQSPVSMRTNSPAVTKKSVPSTPNRSSRSQLFGPSSPPPPVRTYGRRSRNRSQPSTPSQIRTTSSSSTPSRRNAPASSTSTAPSLHLPSLALDYEEPVLLPATPPHSLNSAASFSGSSGAIAHNVDLTFSGPLLVIGDTAAPTWLLLSSSLSTLALRGLTA
ncbi:uncharacterized protein C8R40DRAFT_1171821 [Lentinula edodes]|uniref:uncharacterized protein n=1 Tax=Lentinula edodes TaxID=5353 RepID=UPI001E8DC7E9|nr:uncharacterized protein C8R40DRAFT_1171821 [Lentinula edodes]KAH7874283.1 hypothetical protein C8R40DRAFT_1171821 [Lentinula edodes]